MSWNVNPSREEIGFLVEAGVVYRDSGRYAEAREVLTGVRALAPESDAIAVLLGTVDFQQGDFEGAERNYRLALELNGCHRPVGARSRADARAMRGVVSEKIGRTTLPCSDRVWKGS